MLFLPLRGLKQHQGGKGEGSCCCVAGSLGFLDNVYFRQGINVYKEPRGIYLLFLSTEWRLCPSWLFFPVQGILHFSTQERKAANRVTLGGQLADILMAMTRIFERERTGAGDVGRMEEVRASYSGLRVSNTYFALLCVEWHSPAAKNNYYGLSANSNRHERFQEDSKKRCLVRHGHSNRSRLVLWDGEYSNLKLRRKELGWFGVSEPRGSTGRNQLS